MNTLHFKYAVEVERCGSITQAAENLYMAQPNLSKSIKELEDTGRSRVLTFKDTLGFQIFARTSRGVVPTARGREFLVYARGILNQLQAMEALSQRHDDATQRFSLSMPRAGYIADCFSALVDSLDKGSPMDIRAREASALHTINDVADGQFQLGIFRTESKDAGDYLNYLREKSLQYEPVWEYDALLLLSQEHPLAAHDRIEPENLTPYTQIIYGDLHGFDHGAVNFHQRNASRLKKLHIGLHGGFVIRRGLALNKTDRPRGTGGQTVAQTVAVVLVHQLRLAVHHADGPFVTGLGTEAAAIALLFVDLNNPSQHVVPPVSLSGLRQPLPSAAAQSPSSVRTSRRRRICGHICTTGRS